MALDQDYPPVPPIATGLAGRCPRCGSGKLFKGFLAVAPACDVCGLDYGFADAGDGPSFFVSLIAGALVAGLALVVDVAYDPPIWVYVVIFLPLTILLCVAPLRPLKGVLIALQYRNKAEQGRLKT
jgi:uncharacterized protein (DUF983 family)